MPAKRLIDEASLRRRVSEIAARINEDYAHSDGLICVGVLKGSIFFLAHLLEQLTIPVTVDFLQTSSYGGSTSAGEIRIRKDLDLPIRGRDVILVEDIVDTGYTLRTVLDMLRFRGARSVKLCALLDKPTRREVEVPIDYLGFSIADHFVVGYGLDYAEHYRNLPFIGIYDPQTKDLVQEDAP